ncbi:MAG: adenylate kinase [candidate division Zixibacteria bacterium 4484_95]|nr:MAG: adenylate kinase [candidate division Zixibacteria bacterium 4484_95]
MRLVFLGPPGSGKGTQAKVLAEKKKITHISTGDVLRSAVKSGTELGKKAKSYIDAGALVPDDIILGMIKEILRKNKKGFILDGFPRTVAQADSLENLLAELGLKLDAAVNLVVSDDEVLKRLLGRFYCEKCGADFNVNTNPPEIEGICNKCGGKLIQREDDKEEVITNRLRVYREKTMPVEDFYRSRNLLLNINGARSFDDVTASILEAVGYVYDNL